MSLAEYAIMFVLVAIMGAGIPGPGDASLIAAGAARGVDGNRKLNRARQGGFYRRSQHSEIIWSHVVVVSSCEEGAGAASAVGQAAAVHGVA